LSQDKINNNAAFIWSIAELLRGDFKQSEYGKVILPFVILRRLDRSARGNRRTGPGGHPDGNRLRISEIPDSDFANSRTAVSVIPGQFGHG